MLHWHPVNVLAHCFLTFALVEQRSVSRPKRVGTLTYRCDLVIKARHKEGPCPAAGNLSYVLTGKQPHEKYIIYSFSCAETNSSSHKRLPISSTAAVCSSNFPHLGECINSPSPIREVRPLVQSHWLVKFQIRTRSPSTRAHSIVH